MSVPEKVIIAAHRSMEYELAHDPLLNGFNFLLRHKDKTVWESKNGPVGIRTIDQQNQVSEFRYFSYQTVSLEGEHYVGVAKIESHHGSVFHVKDRFLPDGTTVVITRDIEVLHANPQDKGYMISFALCSHQELEPTSLQWYAPGVWYGTEGDNFTDRSKFCFKGKESSFSVDSVSAPYLSNYNHHSKLGLTLSDVTPGRRETVKGDSKATEEKFIVDDRINLPGLGLRKVTLIDQGDNVEDGFTNGGGARRSYTEVFHTYPGYTRNFRGWYAYDTVIWRFIPVLQGVSKQTKMAVSLEAFSNANDCFVQVWREAYARNKVLIDRRYDIKHHFLTVADYVDRSFSIENGHPQYMTNTGHWWPSSGFLVRNVDLASILLAIGHRYNNQRYIERARSVIDDQVQTNFGDASMYAVGFIRALCESLQYTLRAYLVEKEFGCDHPSWYEKVVVEADRILSVMDELGNLPPTTTSCDYGKNTGYHIVPFFVALYNYCKEDKYLKTAQKAADFSWEKGFKNMRFRDGILDYGEGLAENDMESGVIALECYTALYKATLDPVWLERAQATAHYVETWQNIHDLNLVPFDVKGWGSAEACYGNESLPSYGLSYINVGSNGADAFGAVAALDFYILYEATGDAHYLHFAQNLLFNSTLYTNMDDKSGVMADVEYHAGSGFQNEFIIIGPDTYEAYGNVSSGRGNGHNHNIGWTPFVVLNMVQRILDYTGRMDFLNSIRSAEADIKHPQMKFTGAEWKSVDDPLSFKGSLMQTEGEGSRMEFSFVGTNIEWYGTKSDHGGTASVYLDGSLKAVVDQYSEKEQKQVLLWKSDYISYGEHTLSVAANGEGHSLSKGTFVNVDRLFTAVNKADFIKRIGYEDQRILYKGTWSQSKDGLSAIGAQGSSFELVFCGTEISWYASPSQEPGQVEVYIDGVFCGIVSADGNNGHAPTWRSPLLEDKNHQVKVVSLSPQGVNLQRLEYVTGESVTVPHHDCAIQYAGQGWNTESNVLHFDGSIHYSQHEGDFVELGFAGREVAWYAKKAADQGMANVYIDGSLVSTVDLYNEATIYNALAWSSGELAAGEHMLRIVVSGAKNAESSGSGINIDNVVYALAKEIPIFNSGFETGEMSGWSTANNHAKVINGLTGDRQNWSHTGNYHLEVHCENGEEDRVWTRVENLAGGRRYKASGWIRGERESRFYIKPDGAEAEIAIVDDSPNGWMLRELSFTLPKDSTGLEIGLDVPQSDCKRKWACLDDVRLLEA